jgi:hypothetical protein
MQRILSLILKEEDGLRVFREQGAEENIWTDEEVAADWRRLHIEELQKIL